jgi:hypothetical protein
LHEIWQFGSVLPGGVQIRSGSLPALKKEPPAPLQGCNAGYNNLAYHRFLSFRAKIDGRTPILSQGEKRKSSVISQLIDYAFSQAVNYSLPTDPEKRNHSFDWLRFSSGSKAIHYGLVTIIVASQLTGLTLMEDTGMKLAGRRW